MASSISVLDIYGLVNSNWVWDVQETCIANAWFELLSVVHMMAMLTLSEADTLMIPKDYSGSGYRVISTGLFFSLIWLFYGDNLAISTMIT